MIYLRNTTESQKIYIERQSIQTANTREINYITSGDVINIVDSKLEPYSTTEEVEGMISSAISGTVTTEQMNQAIQSAKTEIEAEIPSLDGYATEEWVQEQGYLTEHQSLSAYSTTVQMNTAIDNAVSGKQDTLVSGTNIKTINGESILGEGNVEVITDLSDYWTSAETKTAIDSAIATESARTESTYLKEHQSLSAYSTTTQVETMINSAKGEVEAEIPTKTSELENDSGFLTEHQSLSGYATHTEVESAVNQAIEAETARTESTYLKEHQSLSAYSTTVQVQGMISSATSGMATEEWVQEQGYLKEHQSLSGLFDSVNYISADKKIYFYDKDNTLVGQVDTTDFIKDGMVGNVYISGQTLYIVFNTDAGKETIELDLTDIFDASNYYTKTETDNLIGTESARTDTAIENAIATETARTESTYLKEHQSLSAYSTTVQVQGMISSAISGTVTTEQMNQAIQSAKTEIEAEIPSLDGYATEEWVQEQGYLTEHQSLSAYSTTEQMNTAIATAKGEVEAEIPDVSDFVTSDDVKTQIEAYDYVNSGNVETQVNTALEGYYTSGQTDTLLGNKQDTLVSGTNIKTINNQSLLGEGNVEVITDLSDYWTSAETNTAIENAIEAETARTESTYLKEHQSLSAYSTTEQMNTAINTAVGNESARTDTAIENAVSSKQDTLVSGTNIKTINNQSLLGSGNIDIQGGGSSYTAGTNIDITDNVISVTGITIPDVSDFVTSADVQTQVNNKLEGYYTSAQTDTVINTALEGYYTSGQTDTLLENKQDTLVSGTNIKTINNQSLLGSGNIVIQGGSGGSTNVIELTKAEYDALTSYIEDAIYVITDAETVNLNDFATSADVETLSGNVETLSGDVSNKVDKINTSASSDSYRTPKWNNQGQVTGYTQLYTSNLTINGNSNTTIKTSNSSYPSIFAPTSAGSAGQPLLSAGSGAPTWATFKFWYGTQSQYDAITTKDNNTIYFVKDD